MRQDPNFVLTHQVPAVIKPQHPVPAVIPPRSRRGGRRKQKGPAVWAGPSAKRWVWRVLAALALLLVLIILVLGILTFIKETGAEPGDLAVRGVYGGLENPFILSNTGKFIINLNDPDGVKVVMLTTDVSPEWRVIDLDRVVLVKIFDLEAKTWSEWVEFTSTTTARYIPDLRYKLIKFKAPSLGSGESARIVIIGAPYGAT